ncbi:MAG: hypothetical protein IIA00_00210 [Proteobacteria bacterium]|nr:hypothetical protein [Pseudomonadota bacterium]
MTSPGRVPPALANLPAGALVVGAVTGLDAAGRVLVRTTAGTLVLASHLDLRRGSTVTLRVRGGPVFSATVELVDGRPPETVRAAPPTPLPAPESRPLTSLDLARGWPALREAVEALRQIDPQLAGAMVERAVPHPGGSLAATALAFLAALRGGNLASWLGRAAVRALEDSGRGNLVRRLAADFGQIARLADQPTPGDWQPFLVPVYDGDALRQLRLFVRRRRDDAKKDDGEARFVVEVDLSRLGEVQLDGFLHQRRFDLILRSRVPLADGARRDIAAIFSQGLALGRLTGALSFQVTKRFPVAPLEAIAAGKRGGVVA